jgi:hypothetical protein
MGAQASLSKSIILLSIFLMAVALNGCASSGGGSSKKNNHHGNGSRGSLSTAVDQAADEPPAGRGSGASRTKNDHKNEPNDKYTDDDSDDGGGSFLGAFLSGLFFGNNHKSESYIETGSAVNHDNPAPAQDFTAAQPLNSRKNLTFWWSKSHLGGDTIESVSTVSVLYSRSSGKRFRGHLGFYVGTGREGSQQRVQDGISSIWEFGLDLGGREYLTPSHTFMGLYILAGVRAGSLAWTYQNAVDSITSDAVFILTPYLGLGGSIVQMKPIHLGASVTWGGRFTISNTYEGFENDLFRDVGELRLNLEASFYF